MTYLRSFTLPTSGTEDRYFMNRYNPKVHRTLYKTYYPFQLFYKKKMPTFTFEEPVTIFYGSNGSGKSTLLNLIAEKVRLARETPYNRSEFFDDYVSLCECEFRKIPLKSRIITSDDVFNFLIDIRHLNDGVDTDRAALYEEYAEEKARALSGERFQMTSLDDYHALKRRVDATKKSQSEYVKERTQSTVREQSNGESAFWYFTEEIGENALYLLDEPENSLAPEMQLKLLQFLTESAYYFGCQLVLATHSPFLLSLKGAKVYDLDADSPTVRHWTELENVRTYYRFFQSHGKEFTN